MSAWLTLEDLVERRPASDPLPTAIGIRGRSGSGKTLLVEQLIAALRRRGLRVGTVKHAHHATEPDTPGKDSHRHYEAGADRVLLLGPQKAAWFVRRDDDDRLDSWLDLFRGAVDLVLVEGFKQESLPEVRVTAEGEWFDLLTEPLAEYPTWLVRRPLQSSDRWQYPAALVEQLATELAELAQGEDD